MKSFVELKSLPLRRAGPGQIPGAALLFCAWMQIRSVAAADGSPSGDKPRVPDPPPAVERDRGRRLFALNCAHCHGADARGDEGPDLHGVKKSDARIAAIIRGGIPGEMPRFATKFGPNDLRDLIAFIRSLDR